jgi:hypothetical protein
MTPEAIYAAIATGTGMLGWALGRTFRLGSILKTVEDHTEDIGGLKEHASDLTKHLVPGREDANFTRIERTMKEGFTEMGVKLDNVNARCESRIASCASHFGLLDARLAGIHCDDVPVKKA